MRTRPTRRFAGGLPVDHAPSFRPSARARLILPVVLSAIVQVPFGIVLVVRQPDIGVLGLALALLGPLLLFARRRWPGPTVVLIVAAALIEFVAIDVPRPPFVSLAFAIVSAVIHGARLWAWIAVVVAGMVALAFSIIDYREWIPAQVGATTFGVLLTFGFAEGMRARREQMAAYRVAQARHHEEQVQAERVRIARELHDVLAHSLSQINVQAGVGLHLMEKQPQLAAEALASIKESSKAALDEVRVVLGMLRSDNGGDLTAPLVPQPDLSRLPELVASFASHGLEVGLSVDPIDAPSAVQSAIYRIVQESLTNVSRHARAERAEVAIDIDDREYRVEIADDGTGMASDDASPGRGVLGMTERAELLGGSLTLSRSRLGGVLVTARIPREASA